MRLVFVLICVKGAAGACASETKLVKIGIAAPLTGFSASYGKDEENAAKLAFEEANQ
jgi:branched-chain amino acid transport system substrate-binding protein